MKKGDKYDWNGLLVTVRRVSASGEWADILVQGRASTEWTKRQRLKDGEFPYSWVKLDG